MTRTTLRTKLTIVAAAAALTVAAAPSLAQADVPGETTLAGTVTAFDGKDDLHVRAAGGSVSDVKLHKGTIINPTGLTLQRGMRVTVLGTSDGGALDANEIDTPYQSYGYGAPGYANAYAFGNGYGPGPYGAFGPYAADAFGFGAYGFPYGAYPYGGYPYGGYPYPVYAPTAPQNITVPPAQPGHGAFPPTLRKS